MTEDQSNQKEEFDFTAEGEIKDSIGLHHAWVQAMEHDRDNTDFYGPTYARVRLVWEVLSTEETDDYYDIRLSFRPSGRFRGESGVEQFIFDKTGELRIRQMLDEPTGLGETGDPAASDPTARAVSPDEPITRPASVTSPNVTPTATPSIKLAPVPELSPTSKFEFLLAWGSQGSGDGQFKRPAGIVVDETGNVYVSDRGNHRMQVFDSNGRFLRKWGSKGGGDGQFQYPESVAVDGAGNVYVADVENRRFQVFAPVRQS